MSINNFDLDKFNFYPNPTRGYVYWDYFNVEYLSVLDLKGNKQKINVDFTSKRIDINNLKPGLYFISCIVEGNFINKKLVIQ